MWVRAQRRVPHVLPGLHIEQGERVLVEISRKFTPEGGWAEALAGLARRLEWLLSGCVQPSVLLGKEPACARPHGARPHSSRSSSNPAPQPPAAGVAAMAGAAGLLPCGGTWGSAGTYSLTLLLTPEVALQRCWADSDSLFAHIGNWEAQVGTEQ